MEHFTVADLVLCNDFELFCTFTFDRRNVDRYNVNACKATMASWLHRQRLHSPSLNYLIVPEFHKDGALHFHALIKGFKGRLKDSKIKQGGRTVYNMTGYRSGYTTAVRIDGNKGAVSNYIKKYITKDMPMIHGKKRYWVSNNLVRPQKRINALSSIQMLPIFTKKIYEADFYEVFETKNLPLAPAPENKKQAVLSSAPAH